MTRFDVGFKCDYDCEKCFGSCPGGQEVFSSDEEFGYIPERDWVYDDD